MLEMTSEQAELDLKFDAQNRDKKKLGTVEIYWYFVTKTVLTYCEKKLFL